MCDNDHILGLFHSTNFSNVLPIIKSKYLKSVLELNNQNVKNHRNNENNDLLVTDSEFPGIFIGILTKNEIGNSWDGSIGNINNTDKTVTFIFSKVLLKQNNWHANITDNVGFITNETYSAPSLNKFIKKLETEKQKPVLSTEIIFHDKLNLKSVQEIWVRNDKIFKLLKNKIKNIPIKKVYQIPSTIYKKYCDLDVKKLSKIIDIKSKPDFCYWVGNYGEKDVMSLKYMKQIAKNCGLKDDEIDKIKDDNYFKDLVNKIYNNRIDTFYYPNYNWEIE